LPNIYRVIITLSPQIIISNHLIDASYAAFTIFIQLTNQDPI